MQIAIKLCHKSAFLAMGAPVAVVQNDQNHGEIPWWPLAIKKSASQILRLSIRLEDVPKETSAQGSCLQFPINLGGDCFDDPRLSQHVLLE